MSCHSEPALSRRGICFLSVVETKIGLHGLAHHRLQRHMMLCRDAPAIFKLGSVVSDRAVHAGNLYSYIAPLSADTLPSPRQGLTHFIAPAHAQGRRFREDELRQLA